MSWARFDDNTLDDPRLLAVSPHAQLLYYRARIYIEKHHTRGVVPKSALATITVGLLRPHRRAIRPDELAEELVAVGLWNRSSEGWYVAGWEQWKAPERDPDERKEAQSLGGKRSAEARRAKYGTAQPLEVKPEVTTSEVTRATRDGTGRDGTTNINTGQGLGVPALREAEPSDLVYLPELRSPTLQEQAAFQDGDFVEDERNGRVLVADDDRLDTALIERLTSEGPQ
jgi:hypothetical protein